MRRSAAVRAVAVTGLLVAWSSPSDARTPGAGPSASAQQDHPTASPASPADSAGLPPVTDADLAAAFPDLETHLPHDTAVQYFVLFDQLEWQADRSGGGASWDNKGWVGHDRDRLWFRTEGETTDGRLETAQVHLFYGRAVARWWDVVAGVRQDIRPGQPQTWAAVGIQGLAPYWFEIEATAYLGASGRSHARFEAEYELRFTNRLVLQPLVEVELFGTSDPERGIGAGLSTIEAGLRLRYELRRELAPYLGLTWTRMFAGTADFARAAGDDVGNARLAAGLRLWF